MALTLHEVQMAMAERRFRSLDARADDDGWRAALWPEDEGRPIALGQGHTLEAAVADAFAAGPSGAGPNVLAAAPPPGDGEIPF